MSESMVERVVNKNHNFQSLIPVVSSYRIVSYVPLMAKLRSLWENQLLQIMSTVPKEFEWEWQIDTSPRRVWVIFR